MEEVKNYETKKEEMMEKYKYAIYALSLANKVDIATAFEMLETNITRGGQYAYVNVEEYKIDHDELNELAK